MKPATSSFTEATLTCFAEAEPYRLGLGWTAQHKSTGKNDRVSVAWSAIVPQPLGTQKLPGACAWELVVQLHQPILLRQKQQRTSALPCIHEQAVQQPACRTVQGRSLALQVSHRRLLPQRGCLVPARWRCLSPAPLQSGRLRSWCSPPSAQQVCAKRQLNRYIPNSDSIKFLFYYNPRH